jgi:hypothetical protein
MAQARNRWGHDAAAMLWGSATVKLILGGLAGEDLRDVSELAGEWREAVTTWQRGHGGSSLFPMAQKIQTLFIDDIDGSEAEGTVRFGLDGSQYEIDLSAGHNGELRDTLKSYIAHARKVGGSSRRAARKAPSIDTVAVRAWARENGIDIRERGRVPAEVVARYRQATGQ